MLQRPIVSKMPKSPLRIAILGAGPAGLSMAKMLIEAGGFAPTVIEKSNRIGGKSETVSLSDTVSELGTCYASSAHKHTNRWTRELGLQQVYLTGEQRYDNRDFVSYIKDGAGPPLLYQLAKYEILRRRFIDKISSQTPSPDLLKMAAEPIDVWLNARNLQKIERFMHRGVGTMGYGFTDTTPALHALRWIDSKLIISGARKTLRAPDIGWQPFWEKLAEPITVKRSTKTKSISRTHAGITLHTDDGDFDFDYLVTTIAPDEFNALVEPTELEIEIANSIEWAGYTSCLAVVENWFTDWQTEGYSTAVTGPDRDGKIVAARFEGSYPDLGGNVYFIGNALYGYSRAEYSEILSADLMDKGASLKAILHYRPWKYFPRYNPSAIRNNLLTKMRLCQGQSRTFHSGAAFSHEAVSNITVHNAQLVEKLIKPLARS